MLAERDYDWSGLHVINNKGERIELKEVKYVVIGRRKTANVEQEHRLFNEKMVSTGKHLDSDGTAIEFSILQDPDTENIHVRWNKIKTENNV